MSHDDQQGNEQNMSDAMRAGHEESLQAAHELAEQVEQAEQQEGKPVPSQADADETAGTGL